MRSELLFDSEEACQNLDRMLAGSRRGALQLASISGPPGSGKTTLTREFVRRAEASGALALTAVGSEFEEHAGMGVISQLLTSDAMCSRHRRQADDLLSRGSHLATSRLFGRTLLLATDVLRHLVTRVPAVVVVVDDAHHADRDSLICLSHIASRMWRQPIVMVFTEFVGDDTAPQPLECAMLTGQQVARVRCRPLSESSVAAFLTAHLGPDAARTRAVEWHRISGGSPLLLRALLDDETRPEPERESGVRPGPTFTAAVLNCLKRSGSTAYDLAQVLAVLGENTPHEVLGHALCRDVPIVARGLQVLHASGLLTDSGFRHPSIASAIESSVTTGQRHRIHRRVAAALRESGSSVLAIADHLLKAADGEAQGPECCGDWEVPTLLEAAARSRSMARLDDALRYASTAFRLSTDARWKASILAAQAAWEWEQSPVVAGRHLDELEAAVLDGLLGPRQSRIVVKELVESGQISKVLRVVDAISDGDEPSPGVTSISRWIAVTAPGVLAERPGYLPEAPTVASLGTAFGDPHDLEDLAVSLLHGVLGRSLDADESRLVAEYVLRGCLISEQPPDVAEMAIHVLMYLDRAPDAAAWCDRLLEETTGQGLSTRESRLAGLRAEAALRQGFMAQAVSFAERALGSPRPVEAIERCGPGLSAMVTASVALGALPEAESLLGLRLPWNVPRSRWALQYLQARGHYLRAAGQAAAALGDFRVCGELMRRWGMDLPALVPWRLEIARTYLALGRIDRATEAVDEQLAVLPPGFSRVRGMTLRTLAALQRPAQRCSLLGQAVDQLQAVGDHAETAAALAELSQAQRDRCDLERARRTARRANEAAVRCAQPAEARITRFPVPSQGGETGLARDVRAAVGVLSDAEFRVAVLAARGSTNREIAHELFITQSTVEQHLTRIYRKLSVRQRSQLREKLASLHVPATRGAQTPGQ